MTESIGTARLDIVVDTSNFDAAINSAKRSVSGMSKAAQDEYNKLNAAEKRRVDSLIKQADTLNLTRQQQILYNAALKGTPTHILDELKNKLGGTAVAAKSAGIELNKYGVSAKQTSAALRGVPAQLTDIFTALQGGQRPLTVLIQQGGQLKDMFGGIVPAARALGGAIAGLINPFTVAAGAAGALFLAWKQGSDEAVGFNQALALTGNTAGVTTQQLQGMALAISQTIGTQHQAAAALAEVAKSGKFTGEQLREVALAAVAMEKATGQAVSETVAQFATLADEPVKALLKLNDTYHFLTTATYEQVKALQAQGREEEAISAAISAASAALTKRANDVVSNASYMERAWRGLGAVVRQVWDDMRNAGRASTEITQAQMKIASANSELNALSSRIKTSVANGAIYSKEREARDRAEIARLVKVKADAAKAIAADPAAAAAKKRSASQRADEAIIALQEGTKAHASAEERRAAVIKAAIGKADAAIALATATGNAAKIEEAKRQGAAFVAAIKAENEKAASAVAATGGGGRSRASGGGSRSAAARAVPGIDTGAAQRELERLAAAEDRATQSFLAIEAQLQGPMAVAILDHKQRVAELNALAEQSPEASARLSAALELEAKRHAEVAKEIEAQSDPMKGLLEDMAFELEMIGKSNAERAVMLELRRQNIDLATAEGKAVADAALASARAMDEEAKARQTQVDLMDDFRQGAANALTDFVTGTKSAKDALKDFFDDMAQRITQAIAEKWIAQLFGNQGTTGGGTQGGGWLSAIMGLFANANGNAFQGGNVTAFATGGVVSAPTMFGMSGGRLGLMGEAGPEAILPLHRGPDGKLGVKAANDDLSRSRGDFNQIVNLTIEGRPDRRTPEQYERAAGRAARRGMARTGS